MLNLFGNPKICLLKHEIALYTESTEAVCGSQMSFTPFVSHTFYYILGSYLHRIQIFYLVCLIYVYYYVYFMS